MFKAFKEFAIKGNLVDIAVAFVMGAAFGKVVTGFIEGIVMPIIGKLTAGVDFRSLKYILSEVKVDAAGKEIAAEAAITYGAFITILIDFFLISLVMFFMVKAINRWKSTPQPKEEKKTTSEEQKLLMEIRDLLKK